MRNNTADNVRDLQQKLQDMVVDIDSTSDELNELLDNALVISHICSNPEIIEAYIRKLSIYV